MSRQIAMPKPQIPDLPEWPPPIGTKFRWHRKLCHVRGIVDEDWYVYRFYSQRRGWRYFCESKWFWQDCILRSREG